KAESFTVIHTAALGKTAMFRGFACKIAVGDGEPKLAAVKLKALQYCTIKKEKSKAVWRSLTQKRIN
ncbi:MAG: hypothetical protein U0M08_02050, partial [Clostridia bacterium]|nr:hypothetical protein [Clostridia bacterium]